MTRKTGKALQRARQQMRAARLARAKRELAAAGIPLTFKRPPARVLREKGEELRRLYFEMYQKKPQPDEEGWVTPEELPDEAEELPAESREGERERSES
jgi:hypothetical protein